jgi:hypothetical protein
VSRVKSPAERSDPHGFGQETAAYGSTQLRTMLPSLSHQASLNSRATGSHEVNRHRPHGAICTKCGTQSTKYVVDGACTDTVACAKRAW